jgi:hypothetical protein
MQRGGALRLHIAIAVHRRVSPFIPALLVLLSAGCGSKPSSSNVPSPSPLLDVTGTWAGQVQESGGASAALTLRLQQQDHAVTGDFTIALSDGASGTGQISGSITGAKFEFTFVSPESTCPATAGVGQSTMTGSFLCSGVTAQFTLTRQPAQ